ncbi:hypothetical protein [Aquimarina agarivorans]|uniref:hypothetical protein n=1 Tax=Aquimarina agarivorans TaxID=980584 RepID=UPI000248F31C|nr:hypothetical protein [Aquimarina agarivorans]
MESQVIFKKNNTLDFKLYENISEKNLIYNKTQIDKKIKKIEASLKSYKNKKDKLIQRIELSLIGQIKMESKKSSVPNTITEANIFSLMQDVTKIDRIINRDLIVLDILLQEKQKIKKQINELIPFGKRIKANVATFLYKCIKIK